MKGYLQRLFDSSAAAVQAPALKPIQRSQSPLVALDQRLASPEFTGNFELGGIPEAEVAEDYSEIRPKAKLPALELPPLLVGQPPAPPPTSARPPRQAPTEVQPKSGMKEKSERVATGLESSPMVRRDSAISAMAKPSTDFALPDPTPGSPAPTPRDAMRGVPAQPNERLPAGAKETILKPPPAPPPSKIEPTAPEEKPGARILSAVVEPILASPSRDSGPAEIPTAAAPPKFQAQPIRPAPIEIPRPLPPPTKSAIEWRDIAPRVEALVRETLAERSPPMPPQKAEMAEVGAAKQANPPHPTTAEAASVIGPINRPPRHVMLFGSRLR